MPAATQTTSLDRPSTIAGRQLFAWQGWSLSIPREWNPLKLDGDWSGGVALLADLSEAKAGMRWAAIRESDDPAEAARKAMIGEVGVLAAEEARELAMPESSAWRASLLYVETEPPGRDVWVGVSAATGRLVQVAYHARRRDRALERDLLPTLADTPADRPMRWSALDLSCVTPAGFKLTERSFAAGDLRMAFSRGVERLTVRQIGPAALALARQPLEKWLAPHPLGLSRVYRAGERNAAEIDRMQGVKQRFIRRRRFVMHWRQPREIVLVAVHDPRRDRIVIVEGSSEDLAMEVAKSVGGENA